MEEEEKDKPSQKLPQISLEKLLDATTDILLILNSRGEVSFINQKGCELLDLAHFYPRPLSRS